jgi:hypothetical protein
MALTTAATLKPTITYRHARFYATLTTMYAPATNTYSEKLKRASPLVTNVFEPSQTPASLFCFEEHLTR